MVNRLYETILIVDKHAKFRASLKGYLRARLQHVKVLEASSEKAGVRTAVKERPDVALIDAESGGSATASAIRRTCPRCKNIILANEAAAVLCKAAKNNGIVAYVDKKDIVTKLLPILDKQLPKNGACGRRSLKSHR
ncbi:MAG: hypothetical protein A3C36_04090 [Omnitrophica WOR_2 bacterium RIFCSPHIGHO2_02_FULL_52_10]|nr:MAG: hypothetical protein A3C36_04090 [Omnitrophica WOR_2 bacterium RIFCSPHIGHO2_02_FULL_52_10]